MIVKLMFTSTPSQFINNEYTLDSSVRLEDQSYILFPSTKVGETFYTAGKEVGPVVVRQTGQVYDDVTLGVINQANNVAPNLTNKYILDSRNSVQYIENITDYIGSGLPGTTPASSKWGARGFLSGYIYEKYNQMQENKQGE